jgi:hypothetical protein
MYKHKRNDYKRNELGSQASKESVIARFRNSREVSDKLKNGCLLVESELKRN